MSLKFYVLFVLPCWLRTHVFYQNTIYKNRILAPSFFVVLVKLKYFTMFFSTEYEAKEVT